VFYLILSENYDYKFASFQLSDNSDGLDFWINLYFVARDII
jgi:hypothetical protein